MTASRRGTGSECPRQRCRGLIERIVLGQRATFFFPSCRQALTPLFNAHVDERRGS